MEAFNAGTLAGAGSFRCDSCGFAIALHERDPVPECPECGGDSFRRSSLFGEDDPPAGAAGRGGRARVARPRRATRWSATATTWPSRTTSACGSFPLQDGWTRIGRSLSAHVRFDDPTVSRRHALLYRDDDGARILDDRSLNGVFRNGERVELAELEDGDEISIGRFRLFFVSLVELDRTPSSPDPLHAT